MKDVKKILFLVLLVGLFMSVSTVLMAAEGAQPFLPGITSVDEHPNGCVDCHKNGGEGKDYRLNVSLAAIGHVKIDAIVKTIPNDCMICHKEGSKAEEIQVRLHEAHYNNPDKNHFVAFYQGACLNCHKLDVASGEMSFKSGPKNW